jgi:hypothetical protein
VCVGGGGVAWSLKRSCSEVVYTLLQIPLNYGSQVANITSAVGLFEL